MSNTILLILGTFLLGLLSCSLYSIIVIKNQLRIRANVLKAIDEFDIEIWRDIEQSGLRELGLTESGKKLLENLASTEQGEKKIKELRSSELSGANNIHANKSVIDKQDYEEFKKNVIDLLGVVMQAFDKNTNVSRTSQASIDNLAKTIEDLASLSESELENQKRDLLDFQELINRSSKSK